MVFQPTLPARGATRHRSFRLWQQSDFNPRSPHGERRFIAIIWRWMCRFQPTLPARGATRRFSVTPRVVHISTHAPRTGSDRHARHRLTPCSQFQPTLPARGATGRGCGRKRLLGLFQPTLPARGATRTRGELPTPLTISTHAPRTGSDFCYTDSILGNK